MSLYYSFSHRNRKQVALISEELEASWQIAIIDHVEKAVCGLLGLYLTKMHSLGGKFDAIAIGLTLATEFNLVATECAHFE